MQRPFLRDTAELSRRLRPVAVEIERSLPLVADAFEVGAPVQARVPMLYRNTENVFNALEDLASNPRTLMGLRDLRRTLEVATPLVEYVAPYQTVCNYATYWLTGLSEHVSETVPGGTGQRSAPRSGNNTQDNRVNSSEADRPVDVPVGHEPKDRHRPAGRRPPGAARRRLRQGDRRPGQRRLRGGPARLRDRARASRTAATRPPPTRRRAAAATWCSACLPALSGGTYKSRELGIDNLKDVP